MSKFGVFMRLIESRAVFVLISFINKMLPSTYLYMVGNITIQQHYLTEQANKELN